jgi:hypothetical protein
MRVLKALCDRSERLPPWVRQRHDRQAIALLFVSMPTASPHMASVMMDLAQPSVLKKAEGERRIRDLEGVALAREGAVKAG